MNSESGYQHVHLCKLITYYAFIMHFVTSQDTMNTECPDQTAYMYRYMLTRAVTF